MKERKMQKISTCLWFDTQAEEAADFYVSVFDNSRILSASRYGDAGPGTPGQAMTVEFEIEGRKFMALNGGPAFTFNEAVSFVIDCSSQDEVDRYWAALTAGGSESQCGWLKDKFGVSWQVVPSALGRLLGGPDPAGAQRAMEAMLGMRKLEISELEAAYNGS
jgi:predicted 3-demethylubiquinone-9 3-methyltransferase (glyoxalase superfamily)